MINKTEVVAIIRHARMLSSLVQMKCIYIYIYIYGLGAVILQTCDHTKKRVSNSN